jgi:Protein of unknown function (DUF2612).
MMDLQAQAQSRAYAQYRDKPKTVEWIGINGEMGSQLEAAFDGIANSYDIDAAGTDELDILGRIVVIDRSFESGIEQTTNMFGRTQFGNGQFQVGSIQGTEELNNDIYRILIKAKIAKNNNDATLDGIIESLAIIVETDNIMIRDNEDMSFDVLFDSLTEIEKQVLQGFDIIPKPQGVRINTVVDESAVTQFGRSQFGGSQFAYTL